MFCFSCLSLQSALLCWFLMLNVTNVNCTVWWRNSQSCCRVVFCSHSDILTRSYMTLCLSEGWGHFVASSCSDFQIRGVLILCIMCLVQLETSWGIWEVSTFSIKPINNKDTMLQHNVSNHSSLNKSHFYISLFLCMNRNVSSPFNISCWSSVKRHKMITKGCKITT